MRLTRYRFPEDTDAILLKKYGCDDDCSITCSVTTAKKLLKQYGGVAWTEHMDRDGCVFETSMISLKGNNSEFHYNRHL